MVKACPFCNGSGVMRVKFKHINKPLRIMIIDYYRLLHKGYAAKRARHIVCKKYKLSKSTFYRFHIHIRNWFGNSWLFLGKDFSFSRQ